MTEKDLLEWLTDNVDHSIKAAEDKFSAFDAWSEKYDCYIELKCRRKHYPDLILEKKKFDAITADIPAFYICSTPKGIYSWKLEKGMKLEWIKKSMPQNTDFGKRKWIEKEIAFLQIKDARVLK